MSVQFAALCEALRLLLGAGRAGVKEMLAFIRSFIRSPIHSLVHPFIQSSFRYSFARPSLSCYIHSFIQSLIRGLIHLFFPLPEQSFDYTLIRSFNQ